MFLSVYAWLRATQNQQMLSLVLSVRGDKAGVCVRPFLRRLAGPMKCPLKARGVLVCRGSTSVVVSEEGESVREGLKMPVG